MEITTKEIEDCILDGFMDVYELKYLNENQLVSNAKRKRKLGPILAKFTVKTSEIVVNQSRKRYFATNTNETYDGSHLNYYFNTKSNVQQLLYENNKTAGYYKGFVSRISIFFYVSIHKSDLNKNIEILKNAISESVLKTQCLFDESFPELTNGYVRDARRINSNNVFILELLSVDFSKNYKINNPKLIPQYWEYTTEIIVKKLKKKK